MFEAWNVKQDVARFQIVWQLQMSRPNRLLFSLHELLSVINLFMGHVSVVLVLMGANFDSCLVSTGFHRFPRVTLDLWKHSETFGNSTVVFRCFSLLLSYCFPIGFLTIKSSLWDPDADLRAHIWMRIRHFARIERMRPSARIVGMLVLVWPAILGVAIVVVAVVATQMSCMRKEATGKEKKENASLVAKDTKKQLRSDEDYLKVYVSKCFAVHISIHIITYIYIYNHIISYIVNIM